MERDWHRERLTDYDPTTDYKAVLDRYNRAVEARDAGQVGQILKEQGGIIPLTWKVWYQEQMNKDHNEDR